MVKQDCSHRGTERTQGEHPVQVVHVLKASIYTPIQGKERLTTGGHELLSPLPDSGSEALCQQSQPSPGTESALKVMCSQIVGVQELLVEMSFL